MIRSSHPSLSALKKEYKSVEMGAEQLCHEIKQLADRFKDCFAKGSENEVTDKDLTDRLLRHYVSEGLVSHPERDKSGNQFGFQQIMELLAIRRLQSERSLTMIGIRELVRGRGPEELYRLVTDGAQLRREHDEAGHPRSEANAEALRAIREIEAQGGSRQRRQAGSMEHLPGILADHQGQWKTHHALAPGLEVVISEHFEAPPSSRDLRQLMDEFRNCLTERRRRPNR